MWPAISIAGESQHLVPAPRINLVTNSVTVVVLNKTGHRAMENHPKATMDAVTAFP